MTCESCEQRPAVTQLSDGDARFDVCADCALALQLARTPVRMFTAADVAR
jgi:protein-arginine kinase activator protein McsA